MTQEHKLKIYSIRLVWIRLDKCDVGSCQVSVTCQIPPSACLAVPSMMTAACAFLFFVLCVLLFMYYHVAFFSFFLFPVLSLPKCVAGLSSHGVHVFCFSLWLICLFLHRRVYHLAKSPQSFRAFLSLVSSIVHVGSCFPPHDRVTKNRNYHHSMLLASGLWRRFMDLPSQKPLTLCPRVPHQLTMPNFIYSCILFYFFEKKKKSSFLK